MADFQKDATKTVENAAQSVTSYQRKLLDIAQENTLFAFEYAQALTAMSSPADFMKINGEFAQKRMEMFQRHTQELASLAPSVSVKP